LQALVVPVERGLPVNLVLPAGSQIVAHPHEIAMREKGHLLALRDILALDLVEPVIASLSCFGSCDIDVYRYLIIKQEKDENPRRTNQRLFSQPTRYPSLQNPLLFQTHPSIQN